jgi:hypothetical protein
VLLAGLSGRSIKKMLLIVFKFMLYPAFGREGFIGKTAYSVSG